MSRLDILPQSTPRLVDAQSSRNPSPIPHSQAGNGDSAEGHFGSVLEGLSDRSLGSKAGYQQNGSPLSDEAGKLGPESSAGDPSLLQTLLPSTMLEIGAIDAATLQAGGSVLSLLEGLLPRIAAHSSNAGGHDSRQQGGALTLAYPTAPQHELDETNLVKPGLGARMSLAVQMQETHFRPLIDNFNSAPAATVIADPFASHLGGQQDSSAVGISLSEQRGSSQPVSEEGIEDLSAQQMEAGKSANKIANEHRAERIETQKKLETEGARVDSPPQSSATFHQIARAIVEDTGSASSATFIHSDSLNRVALARASGDVLRVLHLQLKPAELGLVTIKLRLAGDGLEMELQAESEETAELLRNDAEKLSSLLRTSGYRPDAITIQSMEAASHDRSSLQRSQQGSQAQEQSFQQGAASGQGGSARQDGGRYGRGGAEIHHDQKKSPDAVGDRSNGIYL